MFLGFHLPLVEFFINVRTGLMETKEGVFFEYRIAVEVERIGCLRGCVWVFSILDSVVVDAEYVLDQ